MGVFFGISLPQCDEMYGTFLKSELAEGRVDFIPQAGGVRAVLVTLNKNVFVFIEGSFTPRFLRDHFANLPDQSVA